METAAKTDRQTMEFYVFLGERDRSLSGGGGRVPRRGGHHGNKKLRCKCRRVPCSLVSRIARIVTASICIGRLVKNCGGEINREEDTALESFAPFHARSLLVLNTYRINIMNRVVIFAWVDTKDVYKAVFAE